MRTGTSLRNPFKPRTEEEKHQMVNDWVCPACGKVTGEEAIEWGRSNNVGMISFQEVLKACPCGFDSRLFVVNNNIVKARIKQAMGADEAIAAADKKQLLHQAGFEAAIFEIMLCQHRGDMGKALEIAAYLVRDEPRNAMAWYNLGCLCGESGAWVEAVSAYERAHTIAPEFADAWYNKAVICSRLGLYEEARLCMERYQVLEPDKNNHDRDSKILASEQGMYGEVRVVETRMARRILIDDQVQGSVFLSPGASDFREDCPQGPGALPESFYTNAWYMIGVRRPAGRGLMLGLGCGAGPVSLLENFPEMTIQVLEIDPVIIKMTRQWFPLVPYFEKQGRLEIIQGDAIHDLGRFENKKDFVILDLYQGENHLPKESTSIPFIHAMHALADEVWVNAIVRARDGGLRALADSFRNAGLPIRFLASPLSVDTRLELNSNWIISSVAPDPNHSKSFEPFASLDYIEESLHFVRGNYRMIVRSSMSDSEAESLLTG